MFSGVYSKDINKECHFNGESDKINKFEDINFESLEIIAINIFNVEGQEKKKRLYDGKVLCMLKRICSSTA